MIHVKQFKVLIILVLSVLSRCHTQESDLQPQLQLQQKATSTINTSDLDNAEAPTPQPQAQERFKDIEHYRRQEVTSATNGTKTSAFPTFPKPTPRPNNPPHTSFSTHTRPKKEPVKGNKKPMYYQLIKKVNYGPNTSPDLQRRSHLHHHQNHRVIVRRIHQDLAVPVKFYIQPKAPGAKGGKLYLPVVPKYVESSNPHFHTPPLPHHIKWTSTVTLPSPNPHTGLNIGGVYKPAPGANLNSGYSGFKGKIPNSYVSFSVSVPKPPKTHKFQGLPGHSPVFGRQPLQISFGPDLSELGHSPSSASDFGHLVPDVPSLGSWPLTESQPQWPNQEVSFDDSFNPLNSPVMPHVYPSHFRSGPMEAYDPSIFTAYIPASQAPKYTQGPPSFPQVPGPSFPHVNQYAVEEPVVDDPRPPKFFTPAPPAQAPLPPPSQPVPSLEVQLQYAQMHGQEFQNFGQAEAPAADIDYSSYQPNGEAQGLGAHGTPAGHMKGPSHPPSRKHFPALDAIRDFSPNYLREEPEYKFLESGSREVQENQEEIPHRAEPLQGQGQGQSHHADAWEYQPSHEDHSQWTQQPPQVRQHQHQLVHLHKPSQPNLQAAYHWTQKTQDGHLIHVTQNTQESRTEVTKVKPLLSNGPQYSQHRPGHHEVVKKQVSAMVTEPKPNPSKQHEEASKQERNSQFQDGGLQAVPVANHQSREKDTMISNGWTPIINIK